MLVTKQLTETTDYHTMEKIQKQETHTDLEGLEGE